MLKYFISIIFIVNINCGLIKREHSNNTSTTHLELLSNKIENVTIPNTTSYKKNTDITLIESPTTIISTVHQESTTIPHNDNLFANDQKTEVTPNTEYNKNKTTTILTTVDNLNQLSTTTDPSQSNDYSTIFNYDVRVLNKSKNLYEKNNGNNLTQNDYSTERINQDFQDIFSTTEATTSNKDSVIGTTIQTTTDTNAAITTLNKNNILLENSKNFSINNFNSSILLKLPDHNKENYSSFSTELYHSPTTSKSIDHQLKINKNYDIVTNEIGNSTIPKSTTGNLKLAKFFKENSTISKDIIVTNSGEVSPTFSGIHKNIKDTDKLIENIINVTEINLNQQNITKSPSATHGNYSVISKDLLSSTSNPIPFSTDTSITITKSKADNLKNNINIYGDVDNIQENNLMTTTETQNLDTSTVNNNVHKKNLNKNINRSNDMNTVRSELTTTDTITISTTEITIPAKTVNINENFSNMQTTENYQTTNNIDFTKNTSTEPQFTENFSTISKSDKSETTTDNLIDFLTSTNGNIITTEFNKINGAKTTENINTSFLNKNNLDNLTAATFADISSSTTISVDNNFTTITNDLKITTPMNVDLFSSSVTEPESSIETNSIEKTEKSTIVYSNTTPFLNGLTTITPSPKLADIKDAANKNDTNTISYFTTTVSSKTDVERAFNNNVKINDTLIANILTKTIGEQNLNKSQSSEIEGMERSSNDPDYNVIIAISVSVIGIVALILLVGFLYVMRKRQKQLTYGQRCRPVSLDAYSLDNVSIYNSVRRKAALRASKRSYGNAAFDDPALIHNNISIADLAKFIERKNAIYEEFKGIPQIIARADEVPQGCEEKNRYANVVPLPETRVILQQIDNDEKTEYINANFVRGPKDSPNYYIACQAPLEGTVVDFWRMIWEQNSRVIIMATDLIENGIEKCAEYLPASITLDNHITFADFQITLKNREVKEKYAVSILYLKNMKANQSREITHFWYKWPETGVPTDQAGVIAMLLEARSCLKVSNIDQTDKGIMKIETGKVINGEPNRSLENNKGLLKSQGPLVIHCSPGTGRTGTIATIDIALRSLETTKRVDIPQIVYYVRRGRASSVQTTEQYDFIYKVVNVYATKITGSSND